MGSVNAYQTADGKRYRVRYRTPNRRQTDKRGFRTKREAELYLAEVETTKAAGGYIEISASRVTIGTLGAEWLAGQSQLKPSSLRSIQIAWRMQVQPVFGNVPVGDVRHSQVQKWVTEVAASRSPTTVIRAFGILAGILDVAVKDRRIPSNPARGVNLPRKTPKEHRYLSHQKLNDLAEHAGEHGTLILVLGYTGIRWGEATGLRVRDIDLTRRRINVSVNAVEVGNEIIIGTPKTYKRRSVAFPSFLTDLIAQQCAGKRPDDLVFATANGNHVRRATQGERTWFKSALKAAKLESMTVHDLRHTAASLAISSGANVKAVQRMLGHASAAMTLDVYANLFDDDLDSLANRLDDAARISVVGKMWANDKF